MRKIRRGFTIVEVSLVLAITALIFVSVTTGISSNISGKRYKDAIDDAVDFLRASYSEVINVENTRLAEREGDIFCSVSSMFNSEGSLVYYDNNGLVITKSQYDALRNGNEVGSEGFAGGVGRTNCAIYGRLVTFGEYEGSNKNSIILRSYDIIGRTYSPDITYSYFAGRDEDGQVVSGGSHTESDITAETEAEGYNAIRDIQILKQIGANVATAVANDDSSSSFHLDFAGNTNYRKLEWDANFETTQSNHTPFRGALVIIRSPLSGVVRAYFSDYNEATDAEIDEDLNVFNAINNNSGISYASPDEFIGYSNKFLYQILDKVTSVDNNPIICIGSPTIVETDRRRAIRVLLSGHNASAIELLNADDLNGEVFGTLGINERYTPCE